MVSSKSEWNIMTPEQKIDRLNDDINAIRGTISSISDRIDRICENINNNYSRGNAKLESIDKKIDLIEDTIKKISKS